VYRARDTSLKREVALKVLPEAFTADPERMARFQREAEVLAALNHPHIAHIHGIQESDGTRALVMELVEGEDLAQRIQRGALPIDDALAIAEQIADALDAAHQRGIIHRDLKPANLRVTPDGVVKVLDFGLANWSAVGGSTSGARAAGLPESPTFTSPAMTIQGAILGTAAYMAPEQAKGRAVDKRADIWALGCVLFEMLTARPPFNGETISEVLASVMKDSPDWAALPDGTPTAARRLLTRCLEKDPKRRLHDAADAKLEIEEARASVGKVEAPASTGTRRVTLAWSVAGLLALTTLGLVLAWASRIGPWTSTLMPSSRVSLVHRGTMIMGTPQISPDGRRVVYTARDPEGTWSLWVRELDASTPRRLSATAEFDGRHLPFWSPDSRSIGYFAPDGMQRISVTGGSPQRIANIGWPRGASWSSSGVIVYASDDNVGLSSISENGGTPRFVTTLPKDGVWEHSWPQFLPDGRRFLFTAKPINRPFGNSNAGTYLGSLDSPEVRRLLPDVSSVVYSSSGHVLFLREGILTAAPFDAQSGNVTGEPVSLGQKVTAHSASHQAAMSVSGSGMLAFRSAGPFEDLGQLQWVDRKGAVTKLGDVRTYFGAKASPDGRVVAAWISDVQTGSADIWILNATGEARQLTSSREWEGWAVFSLDGKRIAYSASKDAGGAIMVRDVDGGEPTIAHLWESGVLLPRSWSPDGRYLLVNRVAIPGRRPDLYVYSFDSKTLSPYLETEAAEFLGNFSPDGRFVTFMSDEGGPIEIWVAGFPSPTNKQRVATHLAPIGWRSDGREILGLGHAGDLSSVPVATTTDGRLSFGVPTPLIRGITMGNAGIASPSNDHARVLTLALSDPEQGVAEIQLWTGWLDALRSRP
jgi:Tol biopolymer transport system component